MPEYKIYPLDAAGRIARRIEAICEDDGEATNLAVDLLAENPGVEVWAGRKRIYKASSAPAI